MGSKKSGALEKTNEGREVGKEAENSGIQLESDMSRVKAILDSIDSSMDEDDLQAVDSAESGYSSDAREAFADEVDTKAEEAESIGSEVSAEVTVELDKANDAADKLLEAAGVTDVGSENADGAADAIAGSVQEYEEIINEADAVIAETNNTVEDLRSSLESVFG